MAPLRDISELALNIRTPDAVPETSMRTSPPTRESLTTEGGFLEAWAQGYNVGSLIVLILIVFCNYRSGIWLHKLILLELVLALGHGTFIFVKDPWYGWYLSATASLLFISYFLHNVVSWLKLRPFLPLWGSRTFIITLLCVQPFWVAEAWSNFSYFNQLGSDANVRLRPWEALLRDPWWIFTTWKLLDAIKKTYGFKLWALVKINRRFGVMLMCMFISIAFLLTDVAVSAARVSASSGINPYWRFALVFKCASDTIFLDDFKSVLDDIVARKFSSTGDTVHRRSAALPHHRHARKRSRSTSRGEDFIECRSLDGGDPRSASLATIRPPQSAIDRTSKLKKLFTRSKPSQRDTLQVPQIQVQQDYIVTSQAREPSQGSRDSADAMLSRPEHAVYNSRQKRASESDASLLIGRLV